MRPTDRILGPARGNAEEALAYARQHALERPVDVESYVSEVYRLSPLVGLDPAIVVAQSAHETDAWSSRWWSTRLNSAGIGITDDPAQNAASHTWANGTEAAQGHLAHLLLYALGPSGAGIRWSHVPGMRYQVWVSDPRYDAYFAAYGDTVQAATIADLAGKWAVDPDYASGICARGKAIYPDLPDQEDEPLGDLSQPPYVLVDAGHRETGTGGADANPAERELTDDLAESYVAALRGAGYRADWFQRDVDHDNLPRDTQGSLDTVALGANAWLKQQPNTNLVFVSCHYNGAHSPYHVIYPDETGLTTAYAGGAPGYDTAANNPLDIRLATQIAFEFEKIPGMVPLHIPGIEQGLMPEGKTGVALTYQARLALFAATVPVRDRCVRLVIEHGGYDDAPAQRNTFTQECAAAFVRALGQVYGKPPPKKRGFAKREPIPDPVADKPWKGEYLIVPKVRRRTLRHDYAPRAHPDTDPAFVAGTVRKAGTVLTLDWIVIGHDTQLWFASKNGSFFPASAFFA